MEISRNKYNQAPPPTGLVNSLTRKLLPLTYVDVSAQIFNSTARVTVIQHYENPFDHLIDNSFFFPKTNSSTFDSLIATLTIKK